VLLACIPGKCDGVGSIRRCHARIELRIVFETELDMRVINSFVSDVMQAAEVLNFKHNSDLKRKIICFRAFTMLD
jgi:hypothetical protein